jgi:hypothetical protein
MRCIACGAEMGVVRVERDDTMMVPGYERQTLQCPTCKEVERRLVFSGENGEAGSRPADAVTAPSLVASLLAEADKDLDESEALLRRAIEIVRGPARGVSLVKRTAPRRVIEIRYDPSDEAAYAAKDVQSGLVVLRHRDSARLRSMCDRLGWQVVDANTASAGADDRTKV